MNKISIRFFNDREVRAIWDEENNKWWFTSFQNDLKDVQKYIHNENFVKEYNEILLKIISD